MKTITSSRLISIPVVFVFCCLSAIVVTNSVSSEGPAKTRAGASKEAIRMFDVGSGGRRFNFRLGRDTQSRYLGSPALLQAVQSAQVQPRSMISDDFNGDSMGDLVIGYANGGRGVISLRQGNLQAISPTDPAVFQAITQGRFPAPFLPEAKLYAIPEAADFLQFGDFNSDGYADVIAAARGSQRMYLLPGDGRGNLGNAMAIEMPGLLTAMQAGTQQLGAFTKLAVGLALPGGPAVGLYTNVQALSTGPESYSTPAEVRNLIFERLDDDDTADLAVATSHQLMVIHGRNDQPAPASKDASLGLSSSAPKPVVIESQNLPFTVTGLSSGDFVFDRNHQQELAILSDDGTIYLSNRGTPDRRPFTKAESQKIKDLRIALAHDEINMETLIVETNKLVRANETGGWNVAETISGQAPAHNGTAQPLFQKSEASNSSFENLLVTDGSSPRVELIRNEPGDGKLRSLTRSIGSDTMSVTGAPIAAVTTRLSVNARPGLVILSANDPEPNVVILAPNALFTVNSTADLPDSNTANGICQASNGLCTLRAAVTQSNHTGGSNTIMVPDNTYTLTLGPPDDEANTGGALEQSGDLDIFSWNQIDIVNGLPVEPVLTAVSITGGTQAGCIIQMGILSPTLGTNVPNNKERILEVNDVVVIGFNDRINVTLTSLTMQNASSPISSGTNLEGGAIYFDGSDFNRTTMAVTNLGLLTLSNVKLTGNTSAGQGGGVWAGFGSLTINNGSVIRANTANLEATGGAAWTGGNTVEGQFLLVDNSTIGGANVADGNQALSSGFGAPGGLDVRGGSMATIQNNTLIQNNIANVTGPTIGGGGIEINTPNVVISNSTISNNKSKGNAGGIYSSARNAVTNLASTLTLTTVNVTGNQADSDNTLAGDGGGIYNFFGTAIIQTNSHVDGNSAFNGGGIFNAWSGIAADPTAGLTVQSGSTIGQAGPGNGNSAKNNGGSIAIQQTGASSFGPITLNSLTFTNNTADSDNSGVGDGGAIFLSAGTITSLNGCTFDGNVVNGVGTGDAIRQTGGTITGAGTLSFNGSDSISISGGTFNSTPGTLNLTGNLLKAGGTFSANGGTVNCNGTSAQSIGTDAITFNNLTINNAAGVTLTGSDTVSGTLTLTSGVLSIGTTTLALNGPVSFTSGTIASGLTGTVNYGQGSANQNVAPGAYGNLTFSNFVKVLPNGQTVSIAGTFNRGTTQPTITGSTVDFNGAGAQTVPAINYNNLTISGARGGATVTLGTPIIGVAGVFTPSATSVVYAKTGNTFDFNGSGTQTVPTFDFNDLTVSNTHGANAVTLVNAGTIGVAGIFTPGSSTFVIAGNTVNFNGAGTQTIPGFNFNNLTVSNTHGANAVTLVNGGTIGVAGTFTPGTSTFTITNNTMNFNGAGTQTIPAFSFNNLTVSNTHGANAVTLVNGGTIGVAGTFTPGTSTFTIANNTMNFNGAGTQTIPAFNFNNLTVSNTHGANVVTLVNGGTIGVAGTFIPGTSTFTIANNTMDFNGAGAQTVPPFNYHHLTTSGNRGGAAITLAVSANIGIAGTFNPAATNNTYLTTGNTIIFNGAVAQTVPAFTFNSMTLNNAAGANLGGNVTVGGALTLTAGSLGVGASTLTLNGGVSATGGSLTSGTTGTVNYNQSSNGQATVLAANYGNLTFSNFSKTLAGSGTIGIAGTFTPGTSVVAHTITGSTINFNGAGAQTIPGFNYNNLASSGGAAARTLDPVNTIRIAGTFTPGVNAYTITGSTIEYNGGAVQSLPGTFTPYNNLTFNNPTSVTGGPATLDVNGNLTISQGTFAAGTSLAITVGGNWTNNGAFTSGAGDVTFDGGAGQAIGGSNATVFNSLGNGNGSGLAMSNDNTVNANLALVGSDITVAATRTLTQPLAGTSSGTFDVNGRVQRNGFVTGGAALSFGNPFNTIQVTAGTAPANIVVDLARSVPTGPMAYPNAVQRTYTITPSAAGFSGTLRLHYLDAELNGNTEGPGLNLWRFSGVGWSPNPATNSDTTNNWVERSGVSAFSPWTMNSTNAPTATGGVVTGRIVDDHGLPVEGAVVRLEGAQNRRFITDANGFYRFENVPTNGFYTVTPSRANYTFSPATRSFTQLGESTDAAFGATLASSNYQNPMDTPEYFVRQHYLDFLGREPDEAGFNFWSDQIIECGGDAECISRRRENGSAAFFLSIEFRKTGGLVAGLYRASYGVAPQYSSFMPDTRTIGNGVRVGTDGWEALLAANTEAFVNSFVNRPAFHQIYDGMSSSDFVDALISHAGVSFTSAERDALVSGLGTGQMTRAEVLRSIAENSRFVQAKFNETFVMMEYMGYLRRDADAGGFAFWLNKLNEFDGNFERAEMVKAFIVSGEYRDRFPR